MLWKVSRMVKFGKIMIKKNNDKKYCEKEKRNSEIGAKYGTRQKLFIRIVKWVKTRYGLLFKKNYIYFFLYFSYVIVTFI